MAGFFLEGLRESEPVRVCTVLRARPPFTINDREHKLHLIGLQLLNSASSALKLGMSSYCLAVDYLLRGSPGGAGPSDNGCPSPEEFTVMLTLRAATDVRNEAGQITSVTAPPDIRECCCE